MKEADIRPKKLFEKYLELASVDSQKLSKDEFVISKCPGCDKTQSSKSINKLGYHYPICDECNSLYCSPRPNSNQLFEFYSSSKSITFWSNEFMPVVSDARREKMFKPKAQKANEIIKENFNNDKVKICVVGAGHGIFLEELYKLNKNLSLHAIEPESNSVRVCEKKGIKAIQDVIENVTEKEVFDVVYSSEVIEHVFSCDKYIKKIYQILKHEGIAILTGLGFEGLDILHLKEKSNSIHPPYHLNFLSIEGAKKLLLRNGFTRVEVFTPGELDLDILLNSSSCPDFFKVLEKRGEKAKKEFQEFLQRNQLSSHIWILGFK